MAVRSEGMIRKRLVAVLLLVACAAGAAVYTAGTWEHKAQQDLNNRTFSTLLANMPTVGKLDDVYHDADNDLIADQPENAQMLVRPTELIFSFIASDDPANSAEVWQPVLDALHAALDIPATYLKLEEPQQQFEALRSGRLHVTAFGTGAVPSAVNTAGFVPFCTFGREDGEFGYKMNFVVQADGPIKTLADLRGKRIAYTRPRSNSGCKAALILLLEEQHMQPERDYSWYYTYGHPESLAAVSTKHADAAPVASDIMARLASKNVIDLSKLRVISESERFPPVAFGYSYNLAPEVSDTIQATLLGFDWASTTLAKEFGADGSTKFVPVNYKDDWANIRRVDQAVAAERDAIRAR